MEPNSEEIVHEVIGDDLALHRNPSISAQADRSFSDLGHSYSRSPSNEASFGGRFQIPGFNSNRRWRSMFGQFRNPANTVVASAENAIAENSGTILDENFFQAPPPQASHAEIIQTTRSSSFLGRDIFNNPSAGSTTRGNHQPFVGLAFSPSPSTVRSGSIFQITSSPGSVLQRSLNRRSIFLPPPSTAVDEPLQRDNLSMIFAQHDSTNQRIEEGIQPPNRIGTQQGVKINSQEIVEDQSARVVAQNSSLEIRDDVPNSAEAVLNELDQTLPHPNDQIIPVATSAQNSNDSDEQHKFDSINTITLSRHPRPTVPDTTNISRIGGACQELECSIAGEIGETPSSTLSSSLSCIDLTCFESGNTEGEERVVEHYLLVPPESIQLTHDLTHRQQRATSVLDNGQTTVVSESVLTTIAMENLATEATDCNNGDTMARTNVTGLLTRSQSTISFNPNFTDGEEDVVNSLDGSSADESSGVVPEFTSPDSEPTSSLDRPLRRARRHSDPFGSRSSAGSNGSNRGGGAAALDNWYFYDPRLRPGGAGAGGAAPGSCAGHGVVTSGRTSMWTYLQGLRDLARRGREPAGIVSPPSYEDIVGRLAEDELTTNHQSPPPYLNGLPVESDSTPLPHAPPSYLQSNELLGQTEVQRTIPDDPPLYDDEAQGPQEFIQSITVISTPPPSYRQRSFEIAPPTYQEAILELQTQFNVDNSNEIGGNDYNNNNLGSPSRGDNQCEEISGETIEEIGHCDDDQMGSSFFSGGTRLFSGRPAVRWNRNMCIDRWTSLPTWVVS